MGMTINTVEVPCERTPSIQASSKLFKHCNVPSSRLVKIDFATEGSTCSLAFRHGKLNKNLEYKSPYLGGDSVHLLSRVTEKRLVHKKGANVVSSFPLATNLYKANSDEFRALKKNKKAQKSVLTLPNEPAPAPQMCTVSDVNDSEYYNRTDGNRKKTKKHIAAVHTRLGRRDCDDIEFYDRDAKYCSQMGINLDCSSTDMLKKYKGDGKKTSKLGSNAHVEEKSKPHDVWAVLRNINRFQFRPSPAISEDSFGTQKKFKCPRRCNNRKDMRFVETRCTEEFAYISSFDVDNSADHSLSLASSFDKITVIDNHSKLTKLCKGLEEKATKKKKVKKYLNNNNLVKYRIHSTKHNNCKPMVCLNYKDHTNVNRGSYLITGHNHEELKQLLSNSTITNENLRNKININSCGVQNHATSQASSDFIYSCDSSKAAYCPQRKLKKRKDLCKSAVLQDSNEQFGVTRMILNNRQGLLHTNKVESPKISPRQTTPKSNNPVFIPKNTKNDIRRRIINQKFPIVILGKDQLSSAVEVTHEEPPQFNGLDQQIWPFMLSWCGLENTNSACKKQRIFTDSIEQPKIDKYEEVKKKWLPINNRYKQLNKFCEFKTNTIGQTPIAEVSNKSLELRKPKAIRQFRDRMLKLLYKNSSIQNVIDECHSSDTPKNEYDSNANKDSTCTNVRKIPQTIPTKPKLLPVADKRPWAKAKWASDFIDNVIRKIKTGAYYTHDNKVLKRKSSQESKNVDIQTISMSETLPLPSPVAVESQLPLLNTSDNNSIQALTLPGFDDALPALEIKSMTMNEISVKYCVTNIIFHFDVTVPPDSMVTVKNSTTLIPLEVSKNQTRTFKCKTSIVNAMLPAELCTILPKMLRNIIESGELLALPPPIDKISSQLSIITEVAQSESPKEVISPLSTYMVISQKLWRLLNGKYINNDKMTPRIHIIGKDLLTVKYNTTLIENLKPHLSRIHLYKCKVDPTLPITIKCFKDSVQSKVKLMPITPCEQIETCTALQLYPVSDRRLVPTFETYVFTNFLQTMVSFAHEHGVLSSTILKTNNNYAVTINKRQSDVRNIITLNISNFGIDFLFDGKSNSNSLSTTSFFTKKSNDNNSCENLKLSTLNDKLLQRNVLVNKANKIRTKRFVKLYKKCKSTSNISAEKTTPLSKITNIDEFFLALGSGKLLSSVFDCQSGHKLLSSVEEMKNWTTEINPRQALLVLLLTNKKDTPNIMRYKPILLQGIAVNRITKANELDMEIEVIERETLQTLPKYEGILYLPASIENQDNLFEELCWIAKTTASDYQKPFDKSSEKLLKALLEKRKKLNPSYLRVMARYVGLGLLKTPNKK